MEKKKYSVYAFVGGIRKIGDYEAISKQDAEYMAELDRDKIEDDDIEVLGIQAEKNN